MIEHDFTEMVPEHNAKNLKYVRIQGKELASNTLHGKGLFSMCWNLIQKGIMSDEDAEFYKAIDAWVAEDLPYPEPCNNQEPVLCYFKTDNASLFTARIMPALWLLDKYHHPYYIIYTNYPGEIIYEDEYQIAVKADMNFVVEDQQSWTK